MTTLLRYHTLVTSIGRVYASEEGQRTTYLGRGLDEIVNVIKPENVDDWRRVKADSDRLLKVWCVKENTSAAAIAVQEQIHEMLAELAAGPKAAAGLSLEVSDTIRHVNDPVPRPFSIPSYAPPRQPFQPSYFPSGFRSSSFDDDEEDLHSVVINLPTVSAPEPVSVTVQKAVVPAPVQKAVVPAPVQKAVVPAPAPVQKADPPKAIEVIELPEEAEEAEEAEEETEETEEAEEEEEEEAEEEEKEEEEETEEPEEEATEVVEPEEEEVAEEEEGLEVEQVTIRGRTYWLDSNTKKLYANLEGDEVGDEVGAMVNGKPVFLAA